MRGKLFQNHPLASYTSWNIGGQVDYFYQPADLQDLQLFLQKTPALPITILGAGTNVLIADDGLRGTVIYLRNCLNQVNILEPNLILRVEAGVSLALLLKHCLDLGATDAVFMSGIPGTVGGALAMNAGANGGSIWQYVKAVETINQYGQLTTKTASEFTAKYRQINGLKPNEWFVAAQLNFNITKDQDRISQAKQNSINYLQKRKDTQPLELSNCGSVFRNPPGDYAARLIEASGLKGKQIGGAQVSTKHANFIVNQGGATAYDVLQLMQGIMLKVKQDHNIELIPEVRII